MSDSIGNGAAPESRAPSVYGDDGVTIIGMIGVVREAAANQGATLSLFGGGINPGAEVPSGVDPDYILDFARTHEDAGFDMVLTGYSSSTPDGFEVAGYAAAHTDRLGYLIAHRPGFVAPTLAARKAATLDQLTNGRIALHIITGGNDVEQRQDGDWLDHDARYRRTDEYLAVMRRIWTEREPFDHEGEFYRFQDAYSQARCRQQPHVPLFFGGASDIALDVASRRADLFALWGEPRASIAQRIEDVKSRVVASGRDPSEIRFSLSARPILADTEEKAWERAEQILSRIKQTTAGRITPGVPTRPQSEGAWRLLRFAAEGNVHDERLWMPIAAASGASGSTTCLVGTPRQVADSLLAYYDLGCTAFVIRGFDPLADAAEYGRELIPLVREGVAQRNRQLAR
ncbi:MAG: LLM class flavin-dependent oxidoreductase [Chloroflexota bacterium]|nr:LLM class flavin-dependent oxidoreductase [Chloroflexota bacterium]MDE2683072.1 LLM class flavin-dependent oxidoreductase [Chloroflexota bacterium]